MSLLFRIILLGSFLLLSCEDTKKQSEKTGNFTRSMEVPEVENRTTVTSNLSEEKEKSSLKVSEKITQKNVIEFLTIYGKKNPETKVEITTQHGAIQIQLYKDTPIHRANFIYLVKQGYFNGTFFHRVVPNFIIQGGNSDLPDTNKKRFAIGDDYLLPAEINGRNHTYGSISGSKEYRENPDKQTAPFEFFIFLGPQTSTSHLNGNYTVFAKVIKGMDVVEKIANLPADEGEWPLNNVYIEIKVLE